MIYIYGLICPISGAVKYIGKSINPQKRLRAHIGASLRHEYKHHAARWIRKIVTEGTVPILRILQKVNHGEDWREIERAWIKRAIDEGWPITNSTAGGEGLDYLDPEDEKAYRRNHSAAMKRLAATDRGKDILAKLMAASHAPDVRRRAAASAKKTLSNPEVKERLRTAITKAQNKPSTRKKRSASLKAVWAKDHAGMIRKIWTSEAKTKQSNRQRKAWTDPITRNRFMNRWTPAARALQAQRIRDRQAMIQLRMTPEVRAKQAATLKETWSKRKAIQAA